jgi:SH2 domain-containing protein 4A
VQRKAGIDPSTNKLAAWFHGKKIQKKIMDLFNKINEIGLITRQDAEALLRNEQVGSFLVRVSEKIWGYAISLKEEDRCKHYLVDATNGHYQFPGANQMEHKTLGTISEFYFFQCLILWLILGDLVSYHSWEPITANGKEILRKPCSWLKPPEIFTSSIPAKKP